MTAIPEPRQVKAATTQTIQTTMLPASAARITGRAPFESCSPAVKRPSRKDAGSARSRRLRVRLRTLRDGALQRPGECEADGVRPSLRVVLVERDRRVVEVAVGDRHLFDRLGEEHVLRVDEVVARVLGDLELVAERDRVERTRQLAIAAEDAATHVDLVDPRVALASRDAVVGRVLGGDDADAVGRARRRAERAADALLEPVLVHVEPVAAPEARVHRPLVLRVLLSDRLLEDLLEGDAEALDAVERLRAHRATTKAAVTTALTVASGRSTFQPSRISWS